MNPKLQLLNSLSSIFQTLLPDYGRSISVSLDAQALKTDAAAPYITISEGPSEINTATRQSRDYRTQIYVTRISNILTTSVDDNSSFEFSVVGLIDDNPTLSGLVHSVAPISTAPARVNEHLVSYTIVLTAHYTLKRN